MKHILYIFLIAALFTSCKSKQISSITKTALNRDKQAEVSAFFIDGKKDFFKGNFESAEKNFTSCIRINDSHAPSYFELSKLYNLLNDKNKAIKFAKKAAIIDSENIWYQKQAAQVLKYYGDYESANEYLNKIIELEPDDKQNYFNLANNFIYKKDFTSAKKVYEDIIEKFGFEEGVALQIKQIYLNQEDYKSALKIMDDLIIRNPENVDYYLTKAKIYKADKDFKKAGETYNELLKLDSVPGEVYLGLADFYAKQGNHEGAFESTKKAFKSIDLDIDKKIKILLKILKDYQDNELARKEGDELMEILISTNPDEAKVMSIKADFLVRDEKLEEALQYYKMALKLDNSNFLLWEQLIVIYHELGDIDEMEKWSEDALEYFPQHSSLYYFYALALKEKKKYEKAIENIDIGLNFTFKDLHFIDFYDLMADVYLEMKDYKNAYYNYDRILSMDDNHSQTLSKYSLLLSKNGDDLDKALKYAKRALELNPEDEFLNYVYAYALYANSDYSNAKVMIDKVIGSENIEYLQLAVKIEESLENYDKASEYNLKIEKIKSN